MLKNNNNENVSIQITDGNGRLIKSFLNLSTTSGEVTFNSSFLAAGIYYSNLIVNSKIVAAKKMVLQK